MNKPAYTSCSSSFSPAKLLSLRVQIHMLVGQPCTTRTGAPGATLDQLMTYDVLGTSVASEPVLKLHRPWKLSSERTSLLTPLPFEPPCERTSLLTLPFAPPLLPPCERTCLLTTVALGPIAQSLTSPGPRLTGLGYVQTQPVLCQYVDRSHRTELDVPVVASDFCSVQTQPVLCLCHFAFPPLLCT